MNRLIAFLSSLLVSGLAAASTPCTTAGFQTLLDGMISTGGQYLEVFPANVPQFPAAFKQAEGVLNASTQPYKGIEVLTGNLSSPKSILPASVYATNYINGVVIEALWNQIEPSAGVYDWSVIDLELTRAIAAKKKITISVTAGAYAPGWLYAAPYNVPRGKFLWSNHSGANGACDAITLPVPWSPAYENAWWVLMSALASHLKATGAYGPTSRVKLTGINTLTDELHQAFCPNTNGNAVWQGLGYTPDKALGAAEALLAATNGAFPDKLLSLSVIEAGGMPLINDAGKVVSTKDPTYIDVKQQIINYALSPLSGIASRFAVQWNGFQTAAGAAKSVIAAGKAGAVIGWQTNEFGGNANGAECP